MQRHFFSWHSAVFLSHKKDNLFQTRAKYCPFGSSDDRPPLPIPFTFTEERLEGFHNNKCVMVFTCSLLRAWELRETGRMQCNPNTMQQPAVLAPLTGSLDNTDISRWPSLCHGQRPSLLYSHSDIFYLNCFTLYGCIMLTQWLHNDFFINMIFFLDV